VGRKAAAANLADVAAMGAPATRCSSGWPLPGDLPGRVGDGAGDGLR
jgi:thiamine monophosphate kinase